MLHTWQKYMWFHQLHHGYWFWCAPAKVNPLAYHSMNVWTIFWLGIYFRLDPTSSDQESRLQNTKIQVFKSLNGHMLSSKNHFFLKKTNIHENNDFFINWLIACTFKMSGIEQKRYTDMSFFKFYECMNFRNHYDMGPTIQEWSEWNIWKTGFK